MPQFSANTDTITVQIEEDGHGFSVTFKQGGEDIAQELRELPAGERSQYEGGWQISFNLIAAAWSKSD